jgi:hypothetical protein
VVEVRSLANAQDSDPVILTVRSAAGTVPTKNPDRGDRQWFENRSQKKPVVSGNL